LNYYFAQFVGYFLGLYDLKSNNIDLTKRFVLIVVRKLMTRILLARGFKAQFAHLDPFRTEVCKNERYAASNDVFVHNISPYLHHSKRFTHFLFLNYEQANKAKVDKMDASFTSFYSMQYGACVRQVEEQMKRYTPRTANSAVTPSGPSMGGHSGAGHFYAGTHDEEDERAGLIEAARHQEYAQLTSDVEAQHAMIQYRDQAIRSLQRDMSEVHDMFKDLANLVSEQGHMVDDIESNVNHASNDIDSAHVEVKKAHDIQQKSRSKLCIAAVIITVLVAIGVLITVVVVMVRK
jgi:hypothetical protein